MGIKANVDRSLQFLAIYKENQLIKYVSKYSDHTLQVLRAIPLGVLERLAKLTSITDSNENESMENLYPMHVDALLKGGFLNKNNVLTLKQVIEEMEKSARAEARKERT